MKVVAAIAFVSSLRSAWAHGSHGNDAPAEGETIQQYAQRHMSSEHHIDSFDVASFFQLHDLDRDGFWAPDEIEAIYGVQHVYSQKKSKDEEEHQKKADHIVNTVLGLVDGNKDGKISLDEFKAVGLDGLPNFDDLGAEGHHYDVESEFFLHHEEIYHSTPETQTDESYNHPEDIEHFAHHEAIEKAEAVREAKFQGISVEEAIHQHDLPPQPPRDKKPLDVSAPPPKVTRVTPPEKQDPEVKYGTAAGEPKAKSEWGAGEEGFKTPKTPAERLRKNVPYKYKFKRNWGDF